MITKQTDVIIVGAGHAGIEAALAAARLGCKTSVVTLTKSTIGLMPCNPSIGGPAKGQIVGEIDALGGEMGRAADATHIQLKVLNRSRGPAVQCLRSQNDKFDYQAYMEKTLTNTPNITVIEDEVTGLIIENKQAVGVTLKKQGQLQAKTVVVTTGTFLQAKMHVGFHQTEGGRLGEDSSDSLSSTLKEHFTLGRLKTGTPPRLDKNSINFDVLSIEPGDNEFLHFSFRTPYSDRYKNQLPCHLTHTNEATHKVILNNLDRSPLYTKVIQGTGPRYCPSIEDKIVRFKDKTSHHIFIEPEGWTTNSIYPQGLNTSLPSDTQEALLKTMIGLEDVKILKFGYAVEYDFIVPNQLKPTLESHPIKNLYFAGQINGTSGYEEAGGQGIVAGINAGLQAQNRDPFILTREDSFIGTMIDDLITKDIYEPYRMLTSRSEYRLILRQDNAIFRLSKRAHEIGLLSNSEMATITEAEEAVTKTLKKWRKTSISEDLVTHLKLKQKAPISYVLKRPDVSCETLKQFNLLEDSEKEAAERASVIIKYEGYISKQKQDIEKIKAFENITLPDYIDYTLIQGLRTESRHKLIEQKPKKIGQAKRIAGINPADLMILIAYLERTALTDVKTQTI